MHGLYCHLCYYENTIIISLLGKSVVIDHVNCLVVDVVDHVSCFVVDVVDHGSCFWLMSLILSIVLWLMSLSSQLFCG